VLAYRLNKMAQYKYAIKSFDKEHMARVAGRALPISTKYCVEVCNFIRNKWVGDAKKILNEVIQKKRAVPLRRFNKDIGHKKSIGPGRYPIKVSKEIITLLDGVEANAQFKGLNTADLMISHICANRSAKQWHYGRQTRRVMKRTDVEIVVEERKKEDKKEKRAKEVIKK